MPPTTAGKWVSIDNLVPDDGSHLSRRFLTHWISLRENQLMPRMEQFDPTEVPWALSNIFLIDILDGDDFVYRLASETFTLRYGKNLKGARVSDFMNEAAAQSILFRWRLICDTPAGVFVFTSHSSVDGRQVRGERLLLPFGDPDMRPARLIGITLFTNRPEIRPTLIGDQEVQVMRLANLNES